MCTVQYLFYILSLIQHSVYFHPFLRSKYYFRCGLSFFSPARLHLTSCGHTFCRSWSTLLLSHSIDDYCCSQCQTVGQPCYVCNQPAQRLLPIGNSLPQQAKEMFNRNEETLKKLQDRLSFQQLHFNLFLEVLTRRASELKSRIA